MAEPIKETIERELPPITEDESPFLCAFCEDIKPVEGKTTTMQQELDVCRRCVTINRSVRFTDFLVIQ